MISGPEIRSGRGGEEKNSQPLSGHEPFDIQPVVQRYTTELSQQAAELINLKLQDVPVPDTNIIATNFIKLVMNIIP
jgi:hypothetical protein